MKKVLFLLGVGAFFMASCSENVVNLQTEHSKAIEFSNLRSVTRAASDVGANDNGDNYKVYASYTLDPKNWYFSEEVYGKTEGEHTINQIVSGKKYYWLSGDVDYNFFAYAPASLSTVNDKTLNEIIVDYTVPADANQDFTVADPVLNRKYEDGKETVNLEFKHALAKIQVSVKLSDELINSGYTLEWDNADLIVKYDKGDMHINKITDLTQLNEGWDNNQQSSKGIGNLITYSTQKSFMIMPQASEGCKVQIKGVKILKNGVKVFPVSNTEEKRDLKVYTFNNIPEASFFQGKVYNLTLTINGDSTDKNDDLIFGKQILFNATHADWTVVNTPLVQP